MSDPITRWFNAGAMVLAPVCGLVAAVATPSLSTSTADSLAAIAAHPEQFHVYALGILLSSYLLIPAFFGLLFLLRRASARGAGMVVGIAQVGMVVAVGDAATELMFWKMGSGDRNSMVALAERYDAGSGWIYGLGGIAVLVGTVAVATVLWRSRAIPRWAAAGVGASVLLNIAGFVAASQPILAASYLVMLAALGRAALVLVEVPEITGAAAPVRTSVIA